MVELWSPEHKVVLERRLWIAVLEAQRDLGVDVPAEAIEAYRAVVDQVDLDVDRRARAGHPPRREGPHRGVLRPRRPRAHPQGDDVAGPHRERRAAPGPRRRWRSSATGWSPRWPGWPSGPSSTTTWSSPGAATTSPPRPPRSASASPTPARSCSRRSAGSTTCSPATRPCGASRARWAPQQDQLDLLGGDAEALDRLEAAVAGTSASTPSLTNVGQVYPRSLDLDVVAALVQAAAGPGQPGHHHPAHGRPRAGHRGLRRRPGRLVGHAPQDERPLAASASTASSASSRATSRWSARLAGDQWNEGDVSCSVVRRVALPDAFFAADGLFQTFLTCSTSFGAYPAVDRPRAATATCRSWPPPRC